MNGLAERSVGVTRLVCSGCGAEASDDDPLPFRCERAGDGRDHVLRRVLSGDAKKEGWTSIFLDPEPNPFVRYRALLHSYTTAVERGITDAEFVALVRRLDAAVADVGGAGFRETPLTAMEGGLQSAAVGLQSDGHSERSTVAGLKSGNGGLKSALLLKDETDNVSGSHKARHLFGILLWIEVARATGLLDDRPLRLAIASCGNAALGAATVARAAGLPLDVFVPTDAHPAVVKQLSELGATVHTCVRDESVAGDPCMHGFRDALAEGAIPFGVQGNENGLTLEGGLTLGYELVTGLLRSGRTLDRLFIQVGGGALASSCIQALEECVALGVLAQMPVVHAVQTHGAYPLVRAFQRVKALVDARALTIEEALRYAAAHRSDFMWPWETVPQSIAHGILDDETYDWLAIVGGLLRSGGSAVVVSEDDLVNANACAKEVAHVNADHTGSAGLAGALRLQREGVISNDETVAALLTGRER